MGFFDSFRTGVSSIFSGPVGQGLGNLAGQALGSLAQRGVSELGDLIFGGSSQRQQFGVGIPGVGQFGTPLQQGFNPGFNPSFNPRFQQRPQPVPQAFPFNQRFNQGGGTSQFFNPFFSPSATTPLASLSPNDSQPFPGLGQVAGGPGSAGGFQNLAFPISRGTGFAPAAFDFPGVDFFNPIQPQGSVSVQGAFRPTMSGARAQQFVVPNPVTGRPTWFRPAGQPILFSGDLTAAKRVSKIARRAARKR